MFFAGGAKFATNMLGSILSVVYNVLAHTRHTRGTCNSVRTLIFSSVANGAFCGGRDIFFAGQAKLAINMLGSILSVVYNVAAHTRHTNGTCNSVGTLIFPSVANGAFCGGRDIFFSSRAKFAINMFASILSVVCNVAPRVTRHARDICNSVGTLVFSSVANGAFCGGRDIFFAGGATFAIVRRVVFGFSKAVV